MPDTAAERRYGVVVGRGYASSGSPLRRLTTPQSAATGSRRPPAPRPLTAPLRATIGLGWCMGSGSASKAPESALWKGEAEPRYRCFRITYPSGTAFDSWWGLDENGGTLQAVRLEHPMASVEADIDSRIIEEGRTYERHHE
jgi:hypothetical protein